MFDWRASLKQALTRNQFINHIGHAGMVLLIVAPFLSGVDLDELVQAVFAVWAVFATKELFETLRRVRLGKEVHLVDSVSDFTVAISIAGSAVFLSAWLAWTLGAAAIAAYFFLKRYKR